jgi:hypothetical protein
MVSTETPTDRRSVDAPWPTAGAHGRPWRTAAAVAIVALAVALPLRELFRHQGAPMEEGFMLVFPELVLDGEVPNRDFLHLYGPGSLWMLAGVYELFGVSLATERVVGLIQHLGVIFGLFALALPWGRRIATTCGLVAVLITLFPVGLAAMAWNGAIALAVVGLAIGLPVLSQGGAGSAHPSGSGRRRLFAAGLLAGLALLFRPDLVLAIGLGYGALAWSVGRARWRPLLAGGALGIAPYLVHLVTAGPGNVVRGMVLDPVFKLRGGRTLPVPPSLDTFDGALHKVARLIGPPWSLPHLDEPLQVFIWFFGLIIGAAFIVAVGVVQVRRDPSSAQARALFCVGLLGLGLLPQALQRPDPTHLGWVSVVVFGFLPVAIHVALRRPLRSVTAGTRAVVAGGLVLAALVFVIPYFTARSYSEFTRQSFGKDAARASVNNDGRNFWLGDGPAIAELQAVIDDIDRLADPGDRVIVGPADLRYTHYSDAYLYFLLPDQRPGTAYVEMDPGVANAERSGLAEELARADYFVASNIWDAWDEANDSKQPGSNKPNEVVQRRYCLVRDYGHFIALYRRCR